MRTVFLVLLLSWLAACASTTSAENMSPGSPSVQVRQPDVGPLVIEWAPPNALWVQLRLSESAEIIWRARAGSSRFGPHAALLTSPLVVGPMGPPPDVHPPDGRGAEAPVLPPLVPGEQYTVFVAPCAPSDASPEHVCGDHVLQQATFTASRSYE